MNALADVFPGIERKPGICGGSARVVGTRIPAWALAQYQKLRASEDELLGMFPGLREKDLGRVWGYFEGHKEELEREIVENER